MRSILRPNIRKCPPTSYVLTNIDKSSLPPSQRHAAGQSQRPTPASERYTPNPKPEEFVCPSEFGNGNFADPATCRRFYQVRKKYDKFTMPHREHAPACAPQAVYGRSILRPLHALYEDIREVLSPRTHRSDCTATPTGHARPHTKKTHARTRTPSTRSAGAPHVRHKSHMARSHAIPRRMTPDRRHCECPSTP